MASSIASLVPEPMEKCAVAFASPIRTTLSATQRSQRMFGKLRQTDRLVMMRCFVSRKKNVNASNGRVEPIQEKKFGRKFTFGLNLSAKVSRKRELLPS